MTARTRMTVLVLAVTLAGFAVATRAVGGAPTEPSISAASDPGRMEGDRLHGAFWRPAGSDAERPALRLRQVAWLPAESKLRRPQPDALASVNAVVRLAAFD